MKLLVISDYRHTRSVRPEAEAIIGVAAKGVEVTVMTYSNVEYIKRFEDSGIRVISFHPVKKFDRKEIAFIRQELVQGGYDIMHLFNSKATLNGIRAARGLKVKIALYRGYTGNIHWYDPSLYFKHLNPGVSGIWCIARSVEDLINRNILFGRKKAVTIRKGHHPSWYADVEKADLGVFGVPEGSFVAVITANARPMKGIPYLIKSTWHIPDHIPFYLLLVGNGLETPEVKKLVSQSPHKERIIFTGYRDDSLNIVKAADTFVLSSLYGEAITKSVIEAMSLGVAPVITDIPGNRELVVNKKCGMVVPRADAPALGKAITWLYENPLEREQYAHAAREHIQKNFRVEDTIEELYNFYQKLLGGN